MALIDRLGRGIGPGVGRRVGRLVTHLVTRSGHLTRSMTLGVRVLARLPDGRVLLVKHSYVPGWYLPGGGVDGGETLRAAAVRELVEETGYRVDGRLDLFGVYQNAAVSRRDHVALFVAAAVTAPATPRPAGGEIVAVAAFAPDALPEDTTLATRRRIAEVLGGAAADDIW